MRAIGLFIGSAFLIGAPLACGNPSGQGSTSGTGGGAVTSSTGSDSSSTSSVTSSSSSTGGSGGSGGQGVSCTTPADCPGTDDICKQRTCDNQLCGIKLLLSNMPVPSQLYGDCQEVICDSSGTLTTVNKDADFYDDGNACTTDTCAGGKAVNTAAPMSMCTDAASKPGLCSADAACVECLDDMGCAAVAMKPKCNGGKCVPVSCIDTTKNGLETAPDCGGPDCTPCPDLFPCKLNSDCASSFCKGIGANKTCQKPACDDGLKNGAETDVDCGGKACTGLGAVCLAGQLCKLGPDCESNVCKGGLCQPASCTDQFQNGDETGIDCGGACPTKCGN